MIDFVNAKIEDWVKEYDGPLFHALFCDAPYHLTSIVDRFSSESAAPAKFGTDGVFQRSSRGFMGMTWDGGDIAFRPETWAALKDLLYPGAFGMAYAAARGWHRMTVAIEDAGFIIHNTIFLWSYACLSEDTEVLTIDGWKSYRDISVGSIAMCYNVEDDTFAYMPIEEIPVYDYNDTAYHIRSDSTDQIVTRNHRCIVKRNGKYVFQLAETLQSKESVPVLEVLPELSQSVRGIKLNRIPQQKSLFAKVRVGSIGKQKARNDLETNKAPQEKIGRGKGWKDYCLRRLRKDGIQARRLAEENKTANMLKAMQWKIARKRIEKARIQGKGGAESRIGTKCKRKNERGEQSSMERGNNLFSQTWKLWIGQVYSLSSRIFINGTQRRIYYGTSANSCAVDRKTSKTIRGGASYQSRSARQQARKFDAIFEQCGAQEIRTYGNAFSTLATVNPIHYAGKVWCIRVPTGAFVARRNGKIFITGNSGFPKATRVDTQLETDKDIWQPYRYGVGWNKPAVEPIIVFQKPYEGRSVDGISKTGAGAINIDNGRIAANNRPKRETHPLRPGVEYGGNSYNGRVDGNSLQSSKAIGKTSVGRWPSNFVLVHSPKCKIVGYKEDKGYVINRFTDGAKPFGGGAGHDYEGEDIDGGSIPIYECTENCPSKRLDEQSGNVSGQYCENPSDCAEDGNWGTLQGRRGPRGYDDDGGASRYFFQADWNYEVEERLYESDPARYVSKPSKTERNAGLVERTNFHPSVKPISLSLYLASMLLPPEQYAPRRILNPFGGSGSEAIGAMLAGWENVVSVEMEKDYHELAKKRGEYWFMASRQLRTNDPETILKNASREKPVKSSGFTQKSLLEVEENAEQD